MDERLWSLRTAEHGSALRGTCCWQRPQRGQISKTRHLGGPGRRTVFGQDQPGQHREHRELPSQKIKKEKEKEATEARHKRNLPSAATHTQLKEQSLHPRKADWRETRAFWVMECSGERGCGGAWTCHLKMGAPRSAPAPGFSRFHEEPG